jgi:epoxyqueuosine reductase
MRLEEKVRACAHELGFDLAGIALAAPSPHAQAFEAWLKLGYQGEMAYLSRGLRARLDPASLHAGARSIVVVGANYYTGEPPPQAADPAHGRISNYAWGQDYHALLKPRLIELDRFLVAETGAPQGRVFVDTGPVLERDVAVRAGLGFIGKNTCLIHPRLGSWLFLGVLLTGAALEPTSPGPIRGGCGTCARCLDACPTGALVAPYLLDARRCTSYLTIELRGAIPTEFHRAIGNWVFGCDVCQAVCPYNRRFARPTAEPGFQSRPGCQAPPLSALLALDQAAFGRWFRGSPVLRARWEGLQRNVAVARANLAEDASPR